MTNKIMPKGFVKSTLLFGDWCNPSEYIHIDSNTLNNAHVWMYFCDTWHLINQKEYKEIFDFLSIL